MSEINEWKRALQSLTPGGSEFTEPAECHGWIKERLNYPKQITELRAELARYQAIERDYERAIQALSDIANGDHCDNDGRGCNNEDIAEDALQLLERKP